MEGGSVSLTDDINNLPTTPQEAMPGHLGHHATIHAALQSYNKLSLRMDTAVGTRIFAGDTIIHGDTGYRDITSLFSEPTNNGNVLVRMYGRNIDIYFNYARWSTDDVTCELPVDWGAIYTDFQPVVTMNGTAGYVQLASSGLLTVRRSSVTTTLRGGVRFHAKGWPLTIPGIPV